MEASEVMDLSNGRKEEADLKGYKKYSSCIKMSNCNFVAVIESIEYIKESIEKDGSHKKLYSCQWALGMGSIRPSLLGIHIIFCSLLTLGQLQKIAF